MAHLTNNQIIELLIKLSARPQGVHHTDIPASRVRVERLAKQLVESQRLVKSGKLSRKNILFANRALRAEYLKSLVANPEEPNPNVTQFSLVAPSKIPELLSYEVYNPKHNANGFVTSL